MNRVQDLYRTDGLPAAMRVVADGEGKRLMDDIRRDVGVMLELEDRKLQERTTSADQNIYLARVTSLIGAGIAVAVILLASGLVQRELDRRLKANVQLKESEARFRNLAEAMPQIGWVTRPDGYHEYYNRRWYEYTGMSPEQSIGWGWSDPLHRDDRERSQIRWQRSTDTGESYEIKYRFRRQDGAYRWFLGRAEPGPGRGRHHRPVARDVYRHRRAGERHPAAAGERGVPPQRAGQQPGLREDSRPLRQPPRHERPRPVRDGGGGLRHDPRVRLVRHVAGKRPRGREPPPSRPPPAGGSAGSAARARR